MPTILDKHLVRESTVKLDGRGGGYGYGWGDGDGNGRGNGRGDYEIDLL